MATQARWGDNSGQIFPCTGSSHRVHSSACWPQPQTLSSCEGPHSLPCPFPRGTPSSNPSPFSPYTQEPLCPLKLPQGCPTRLCPEREGVTPGGRSGDRWSPIQSMGVRVPIDAGLFLSCHGGSLDAPGLQELPSRKGSGDSGC